MKLFTGKTYQLHDRVVEHLIRTDKISDPEGFEVHVEKPPIPADKQRQDGVEPLPEYINGRSSSQVEGLHKSQRQWLQGPRHGHVLAHCMCLRVKILLYGHALLAS